MKKCPVCEKTFDDSMRFCQTDGTPLVAADVPDDPYKTMVAGKDDIAASLPPLPEDPFKTMVAGSRPKDESEDLLQIPEEDSFDPMKTMVNPQSNYVQDAQLSKPEENQKEEINIEPIKESAPQSPFNNTPSSAQNNWDVFSTPPPAPSKFNESDIAPSNLSDLSSPVPRSDFSTDMQGDLGAPETSTHDQTVIYPSSPLPPLQKESSEPPPTMLGDSPFDKPSASPISSPFDDAPKPSFESPVSSSPLNPPFKEPESSPFSNQSNPFNQPSFNQGENINQNMQQQDWNPPPAPDSGWQNQNVGQNTPFQPPAAGGGQNQVLPIISLVLGILSICCYISPLTGIAALITGFLGMKNANNNPSQYGGKGLAIAGMITGGIFFIIGVLYYILIFLGVAMGSFNRF